MEDITVEDKNYVEYQTSPSNTWHPALFEQCAITQILDTQFGAYMDRVKKTDCQAELRRLLAKGPPIYIEDKNALPLPDGDTHVSTLWFMEDGEERPAVLKGAVIGEEREVLWEELRSFLTTEKDEDEKESEEKDGESKGGESKE
jgi:hypothetical protein